LAHQGQGLPAERLVRAAGGQHDQALRRRLRRAGKQQGQAGKQQVAWLTGKLAGFRVAASPESGSKLTRAQPAAALVEAGRVAVTRGGWNRALLEELQAFPGGRKDDQVDALARALAMLADTPARRLRVDVMGR
jgi:predicted phage terminase large subunit-like protein